MTMTDEEPQVKAQLQRERVFEVSIRCSACGGQNINDNGQPFLWQYYRTEGEGRLVIKGWYCEIDCYLSFPR